MAISSSRVFATSRVMLGLGLTAGLCFGGYRYVVLFGHLNPFSNMEKKSSPLGANTGIRMSNVQLRAYHAGVLTTEATIGQVDVSKDRTSFDMLGIKNGVYKAADGPVNFAAQHGNYNTLTERMMVDGAVRLKNNDFDIQAPVALLDKRADLLQMPRPLQGTLVGGKVVASNLNYKLTSRDFDAFGIRWQGKVDPKKVEVQTDDNKPRIWSFAGEVHRKGRIDTYLNGSASDDEVLVVAPKVVHDNNTDIVTATGGVTYYSGKVDMVAETAVIYRKEHRSVFTGHVRMLIKPKKDQDQKPKVEEIPPMRPDVPPTIEGTKPGETQQGLTDEQKKKDDELRSGKTLRDYPIQVTADEITYWYKKGERHAKIVGNPKARQEFPDGRWRTGNTYLALYDGEKDEMELDSQAGKREAHFVTSIGDIIDAAKITFLTKEDQEDDNEQVDAFDAKGKSPDRSDEIPRDDKKTGKDPKTTSPPPPPPIKPNGGGG